MALRYLWSQRSEAFISIITVFSVLGVAIGVVVLCVVMAVMTGFEHELREKIVGTDSHIVVQRYGGHIAGWREIEKRISGVAGVTSASPYSYHQGLLRVGERAAGILVRGVAPGTQGAQQLQRYLEPGSTLDQLFYPAPLAVFSHESGAESEAALPGIVIGRELRESLGLLPLMPVSLLSPSVTSTPFGLMPKFRRFVVSGSYKSGLVEYESALAYVSLEEAQKFFGMGDSVSGFEVRVRDVDAAPQIAERIVEALGGIGTGFFARPWTERNKELWNAIRLEKQVYFIVLLLIILMASLSIVTTLVMIVIEKRKDVAVMKTMGATSSSIALIFCIQGAVIGFLGTASGLVLGYLGCVALQVWGFPIDEKVFQMSTLPVRIEWLNFTLVGVAAFAISCLATIYPALRASALEPSDALRYE